MIQTLIGFIQNTSSVLSVFMSSSRDKVIIKSTNKGISLPQLICSQCNGLSGSLYPIPKSYFLFLFLVLEQVIGTTLVLQLCSCDCLTIGSETVNDGTRF